MKSPFFGRTRGKNHWGIRVSKAPTVARPPCNAQDQQGHCELEAWQLIIFQRSGWSSDGGVCELCGGSLSEIEPSWTGQFSCPAESKWQKRYQRGPVYPPPPFKRSVVETSNMISFPAAHSTQSHDALMHLCSRSDEAMLLGAFRQAMITGSHHTNRLVDAMT